MDKVNGSYIYTNIYTHLQLLFIFTRLLAIKKDEIVLSVAAWMDLHGIMLSELSKKDNYHTTSLICGI